MVDRRTFTTLLAGTIAAPMTSFAQNSAVKMCSTPPSGRN